MTAQEIRKAYLDFFAKKGHKIIPRANLVPQDDATTLFTGSGMQALVPYLLGEPHPEGQRLTNSQTCLRAEDIEEVGDNRHTTFFEMLGNWSLGDYFKADQLPWFFEFLTETVGLDPKKLYVSCFIGEPQLKIPKDTEAAEIWQKLFKAKAIEAKTVDIGSEQDGYQKGMQGARIFYYDGTKNWWSRGGSPEETPVGDPCGPDSEVFYDFETEHNPKYGKHCHINCDCGRFLEIGNSVFMAYKRTSEGFEPLAKPNVDFGGGLERIASASIGGSDIFKINLLWPIIQQLEESSSKRYDEYQLAMRVIADHFRAAFWLAVDGVIPSNKGQGYVMRRLLRRAIHYAQKLGMPHGFSGQLSPIIAGIYFRSTPEVADNEPTISAIFVKEEALFRQTLKKGLKEFEHLSGGGKLSGKTIFNLYDTYGFPVEVSLEEADARGVSLDKDWQAEFEHEMNTQRTRSRTATTGQFKGGLGGHTEMHKKYHTANHLMYKALKMVLGEHVVQRGSNITEERLRFDFSHPEKLTPEQIKKVEDIVNEQIKNDLTVSWQEMPTKEAFKAGALGAFGDKYGDKVKVYSMGNPPAGGGEKPFSLEICGGPHVEHTGELGVDSTGSPQVFKITKEESSSAGVRRIKAVLK